MLSITVLWGADRSTPKHSNRLCGGWGGVCRAQWFGTVVWSRDLSPGTASRNSPNFVRAINEFCCMGYTIAIIKRKDAKRILERPLDKIYAVLSETFPPLNGLRSCLMKGRIMSGMLAVNIGN